MARPGESLGRRPDVVLGDGRDLVEEPGRVRLVDLVPGGAARLSRTRHDDSARRGQPQSRNSYPALHAAQLARIILAQQAKSSPLSGIRQGETFAEQGCVAMYFKFAGHRAPPGKSARSDAFTRYLNFVITVVCVKPAGPG